MSHHTIVLTLNSLECLFCFTACSALLRARQLKDHAFLFALLLVRGVSVLAQSILLVSPETKGTYSAYFYTYWYSFAIESLLTLALIVCIYRLAMRPLSGLHQLGMLVFKWVAGISVVLTFALAMTPSAPGVRFITRFVSQLEQTQSILALCLLLFVCFAIRPMGLSYGSRIFGVALGLGIMSTMHLVQSAWMTTDRNIIHMLDYVSGGVICATLLMWTLYFALPEPKRRMILLPTTSPFLRWNQISLALGSNPGFVAVGGLPPEMLSAAEIEVMRRASRLMGDSGEVAVAAYGGGRLTAKSSVRHNDALLAEARNAFPAQGTGNVYPIRTASAMKFFSASSFL